MFKKLQSLTTQAYNQIAKHFALTRQVIWPEFELLLKYIKKGDKVLDVGCGSGRFYQFLKKKQLIDSIDYLGIDNSQKLLKIAQKNNQAAKFQYLDMLNLDNLAGQFDKIFCLASFHHLLNTEKQLLFLNKAWSKLKPNGLLIMTNWNLYSDLISKKISQGKYTLISDKIILVPWLDNSGHKQADRYYYRFNLNELVEMFKKSNFKILANYYSLKTKKSNIKSGANILSILQKVNCQ